MPPVRRLTAILAADVAGSSRLMGADEEGTHQRLKSHLRELIEPKFAEHRGRVVENTGDGFLAEFQSEDVLIVTRLLDAPITLEQPGKGAPHKGRATRRR
jgi:class 3 adenylate cyclase